MSSSRTVNDQGIEDLNAGICGPQHIENVPNPAHRVKYETNRIPGLEEEYSNCGEIFKVRLCEKCDYKGPIRNTCDRPGCKVCWRSWASKEAKRCVERINGFKKDYKGYRNRRLGNVKNMIISPEQKMAVKLVSEPGGIAKLRKQTIKNLKDNGIHGGLMVYHHYRILKKYKRELSEICGDLNIKYWDLIREDALGIGSWRDYIYVSPHFHIAAFGSKVNGAKFYEKTGWVLKFKRHISKDDELSGVIFYFLSHASIRKGKRAETWFGSLSYNNLSKIKTGVDYVVRSCPVCGADLVVETLATGRREECIDKVISYEYRIKRPPPKQHIQIQMKRAK